VSIDQNRALSGMSCPTAQMCVAFDSSGYVMNGSLAS
jgi:hypothetical protein